MKLHKGTLTLLIETWDDPGDYPSNAGAGPLPSYDYFAGIEGELVVELTDLECAEWLDCPNDRSDMLDEMLDMSSVIVPDDVTFDHWKHTLTGRILTLWCES